MKFIEKEQHGNLIDSILINGGVQDLESFKNIEKATVKMTNPLDVFNMKKGVELLHEHIKNKNKIGILIDGDADGFTSAAIMYVFLKDSAVNRNNNEVKLISSKNKNHGLNNMIDEIVETGIDLLVVPDAGSNDYELQNELIYQHNIGVIVIDHHDVEDKEVARMANATIINSELSNMNHNFTGAGMTFLFTQAYEELFLCGYHSHRTLPLVAIGQVADVSDISNMEIRKLIIPALQVVSKNFSLLNEYDIKDKNTSHDLSFGIIPQLNAVARIGDREDRVNVVRALADDFGSETVRVEKRRKNKLTGKFEKRNEEWTNYEVIADKMKKIKAQQTKLVNSALNDDSKKIIDGSLLKIVVFNDKKFKPITGLIANKISGDSDKTAIVLVRNNDELSGSARGNEKLFESFKDVIQATGLVELAQGHANAFGIQIDQSNIRKLFEEVEKNTPTEDGYEVDKLYTMNTINKVDLEEIIENQYLFGGKIKQPLLGFENLEVLKASVRTRGKVMTFRTGGVDFICFNGNKYEFNNGFNNSYTLNIVGEVMKSSWGDITQVVIRDIEQVKKSVVRPEGFIIF